MCVCVCGGVFEVNFPRESTFIHIREESVGDQVNDLSPSWGASAFVGLTYKSMGEWDSRVTNQPHRSRGKLRGCSFRGTGR